MYGLIFGRRRQGKSTLALAISCSLSDTVIVSDPNNQFREWQALSVDTIETMIIARAEARPEENEPIVLRFIPRSDEDFSRLLKMLWPWDDYALIVDEASLYQTPHNINEDLSKLIRLGPQNAHVVMTAHRVQDLHRITKALSTDYFFFRTSQQKDVKKLAEEYDDRLEAILPTLPEYNVVHHWQAAGGVEALSVWRNSKAWFIEIGRGEKETPEGAGEELATEPQGRLMEMEMPGLTAQDDDPLAGRIRDAKTD